MSPIAPILMLAPNGARKTKEIHPALPLSEAELSLCVWDSSAMGVSMLHLHLRDAAGGHVLDAPSYRDYIDAISASDGDIIIQATTEAVGIYSAREQMAFLRELKPEAASVALRELIPQPNYEAEACNFFRWKRDEGVFAQYILYTPLELVYFADLLERGALPAGPHFLLFVLGKKSSAHAEPAEPGDLDPFLEIFRARLLGELGVEWALCAFGKRELDCLLYGLESGGHVRIGFENNHQLPDGSPARDNLQLVDNFIAEFNKLGLGPLARPYEIRNYFR